MQQVLNDPRLAKLDLASLDSMSSGAAYMPPDLRADLDRRAKKAPIFIEGLGFPCHQRVTLIAATLQDTECLKACGPFFRPPFINGTK